MSNPKPAASTKSGIRQLSNGNSVIPSSTRADGSVRKEIRVKPGYKPPEDVEVYKNRTAEAWKHRGQGGIPGVEVAGGDKLPPHLAHAAAVKNVKRREARKRAAEAAGAGEADETTDVKSNDSTVPANSAAPAPTPAAEDDPQAEDAKEARKLAKKLRQARYIQDKKEKGDAILPEQFMKVTRISELIRQLEGLGYDQDGEKHESGTSTSEKPSD